MSTISVTRDVNLPAKQVWDILADFGGVYKFHPFVETSPLQSKNNSGLGATRVCHFYDKSSVREEIVKWTDGKELTVELTEFSLPLKSAFATMRVEPTGEVSSRVTIEMAFVVKFGALGWLMDKLMVSGKMRGLFREVLAGLDRNATTGDLIGENGVSLGKTGASQLQPA